MRTLAAAALLTLALATACGAAGETEPAAQDAQGAPPSETSAPKASASPGGTASPEVTESPDRDEVAQTLIGKVGEVGDPEAFVITLMDESGQEITSLPAGEYDIQISDPAVIHNFRLMGPDGLNEATSVPDKTETRWQVSLVEGEYTYVCDPHPESMIGQFTVTA